MAKHPGRSAASLGVAFLLLLGSGCTSLSPHENFKAHLNATVGRQMDRIPPYQMPFQRDLLDVTPLPNGNAEYRYQDNRTCRYILEVTPDTRTIIGARHEGKDTDCVLAP